MRNLPVAAGEAVMLKNQRRPNEAQIALALVAIPDFIGSGGRDRTADLGVMNHHPGKNLSLCF